MRERAFGIETEYAVVYHPGPHDREAPGKRELFERFERALLRRVRAVRNVPSLRDPKQVLFLENGATFHYEKQPGYEDDGLIEMASPECRDPLALVTYERAKDDLMQELAAEVSAELHESGYRGRVRIGKSSVDALGNPLGAHESYGIEDLLSPGAAASLHLLQLPLLALPYALLLGPLTGALLSPVLAGVWALAWIAAFVLFLTGVIRAAVPIQNALDRAHGALLRRFVLRGAQRALPAFLATRPIYTGAGHVSLGERPLFRLSPRAHFTRRIMGVSRLGQDRAFWDVRDEMRVRGRIFAAERRLHLVLGDALLCEHAQLLRAGATALVLEAIEADPHGDWPELRDPVRALDAVSRDPSLGIELELRDGSQASALEIQRRYLRRVREALAGQDLPSWKREALEAWRETLELLRRDRGALVGKLDWVTKLSLLECRLSASDRAELEASGAERVRAPEPADAEARRLRALAFRIWRDDLRYHELSDDGGQRKLERRGKAWRGTDPRAVLRARTEPPRDTRASARAALVRSLSGRSGSASWDRIAVDGTTWKLADDPLRADAPTPLRTPRRRGVEAVRSDDDAPEREESPAGS